jgi:hypothetical protein
MKAPRQDPETDSGEYFANEFKQKCVLPAEYLTIELTSLRSDGTQDHIGGARRSG